MHTAAANARQEQNLLALLRTGAFRFVDAGTPWFPYTSGQVGPYYVQSVAIEKDGAAYAQAIRSLVDLIRSETDGWDAISGGETRDWDFSNPVAAALARPHLKLYKDGRALGASRAGRRFLHVADLNNEGSSVRDYWKPLIEKGGGRLAGVVAFVDRLEDGYALLPNLGIRLWSVVPLDGRAWRLARENGFVAPALSDALTARLRDRDAWAHRALLDQPDYLRRFHRDPATRAKAERILTAYPRIRADLERILHAP